MGLIIGGVAATICVLGLLGWWAVRNGRSSGAQLRRLLQGPSGSAIRSRMQAVLALCLAEDVASRRLAATARTLGVAPPPVGSDPGREAVDQVLEALANEAQPFRDAAHRLTSDEGWLAETLRLAELPEDVITPAGHVLSGDPQGLDEFTAEVKVRLATHYQAKPIERDASEPLGWLDEIRSAAFSLADPGDRHAAERAELDATLVDLDLLDPQSKLSAKARYRRLARDYEARLARLVHTFATDVVGEVARTRTALSTVLAAPPVFERVAESQLRDIQSTLTDATATYLRSCDELLMESRAKGGSGKSSAALEARLAAARGVLASGTPQLEALVDLDVPLPPDWPPAQLYRAAQEEALDVLTQLPVTFRDELRGWLSQALDSFEKARADLRLAIVGAGKRADARREQLWTELRAAAVALEEEAVNALTHSLKTSDRGLPVKAAVAVAIVEDAAAVRLGHATHDLLPEPEPQETLADTVDGHLHRVESLLDSLERHSIAWAGTNAILLAALDPNGNAGAMLAQSLFGVASVPEHLGRAGGDVLNYLHSGFPSDLGASIHEFIHSAVQNLTPASAVAAIPAHETGVVGLYHTVMAVKNSFAADLMSDNPVARYLASQGEHTATFLAHRAAESPQFHEAAAQVAQAGHITAADALHLLGHIPVVTLAISSCREFRLRRDHEVTAAESIKNIALDVGAVGAGLGAAAGVGAVVGIHGGPLVLLTVPGALAGRLAANGLRKRRIAKTVDEYNTLRINYEQELIGLAGEYSAAVEKAIKQRRRLLIRAIGAPPRVQECSDEQLRGAINSLSAATAAYLHKTDRLTAELPTAPPSELSTRLAAAREGLSQSQKHLAAGHLPEALLSLTEPGLPVAPAWSPSRAYSSACEASAACVTAVADDYGTAVFDWLKRAGERFEKAKAELADAVNGAHRDWGTKQELAAAPVLAVQKALEAEIARA